MCAAGIEVLITQTRRGLYAIGFARTTLRDTSYHGPVRTAAAGTLKAGKPSKRWARERLPADIAGSLAKAG
jgi:hypothetical protein